MRLTLCAALLGAPLAAAQTMTAADLRAALADADAPPMSRAVAGGYLTGMMEAIAAQAKAARLGDRAQLACPPASGALSLDELEALIERAGAWDALAPEAALRALALKWPCS